MFYNIANKLIIKLEYRYFVVLVYYYSKMASTFNTL